LRAAKEAPLAHTVKEKEKLLDRVRRIRGQVEAIEQALEENQECASILQQIAACRGAINGLMAEIMEGEVRFHVLSPKATPNSNRAKAADQLVRVLHTYLK
jgi:DNA-binding FrmR family transcriptional regulator